MWILDADLAAAFDKISHEHLLETLAKIVPVTRGWVACYRPAVSSRVFAALTDYLRKLTYKWACWTHPNKPKRWIADRYFRKFDKFRNDRRPLAVQIIPGGAGGWQQRGCAAVRWHGRCRKRR